MKQSRSHIKEQKILKISVIVTFLVAVFGILVGLFSGSASIIFDGVYSGLDCFFVLAALLVVRLIQYDTLDNDPKLPRLIERFQFGFWHFEPMVLAINGISLSIAVFYGFLDGLEKIWHGGQAPSFGFAIVYAVLAVIVCYGLAWYETRSNRSIGSAFIAIDIKGWIISGSLSLAIMIAFIFALLIDGTSIQWIIPYIDPVILIVICIIMAPIPLRIVIRAMQEMLRVTPRDLDEHVTRVVEKTVKQYGFSGSQTYVERVGRSTVIEIHLILPKHYAIGSVEWLDKVRGEVSDAIGGAGPNRWFTVSFTGKPEWAE